MLESLLSCLGTAAMVLAAYGVGRPCLRWFGVGQHDRFSIVVWSLALGLVGWSLALMTLGFAGLLYRQLIGVLTMGACFVELGEVLSAFQAWRHGVVVECRDGSADINLPTAPPKWLRVGLVLVAGAVVLGSGISALAPPTAGDALYYHLQLPKVFLAEHSLVYLPLHEMSTFPLAAEMWYLWGLAIEGPVAAQMLHWAAGVLVAGASVLLARSLLGDQWAWGVGVVVLCVPGISTQMTAPMNDVALVLFTTLALTAWREAVYEQDKPRCFLLAGVMLGAAVATKYIALLFAIAVAALVLWQYVSQPKQRRILARGAMIVACTAVLVGGAWYARAAWFHGNPVYPFFAKYLGDAAPDTLGDSKKPLSWHPRDVVAAPWTITMRPERFGGRESQLGGLLLAVLPVLFVVRRLRGLASLLMISAVYSLLWYALRQDVRFLLPIVPLLGTAVVWGAIETARMPARSRWTAQGVMMALLLVGALIPLVRARRQIAVACGLQSREAYLTQREPTYRAAALANFLLPPDAHILSLDSREFYFKQHVTRERDYRFHHDYVAAIEATGRVEGPLREAGFTHLLLAERLGGQGTHFDDQLSRLVERELTQASKSGTPALKTLHDYTHEDIDGVRRRYRLIALR